MKLMHFHGFVLIATILFYFLLRKYTGGKGANGTDGTKNRFYISLYIPLISYIIYYLFSSKTFSKLNEMGENIVASNIEESLMSDVFQSSVGV